MLAHQHQESAISTFGEIDRKTANLTTIADNVEVALSMADSTAAAPLEAILGGAAARLVVAIGDSSLPSQKP
ncbi:hypothetical protein [Paraburkholderia atlantica]|uniref:Uncharacterized protein n=1 Tax=Paraburkholderia atlantica TaxID=2654982 RepID=A0A7W8V3B9_PARAM|nr:hypothetical protein [Paraburkholderia atlantica]MBB5421554.1 hypothetical protein [Paraburkholderia atlantica]MBB5429511.1 hypothetical protein [Paraburkholderia atlantica]